MNARPALARGAVAALTVTALTVTALTVVTPAADAVAPPYNVLAISGTGGDAAFGQDIRADLTGAAPTWSANSFSVGATVSTPGDSARQVAIAVHTADDSAIAAKNYAIPGAATVTVTRENGEQCSGDGGTLRVNGYNAGTHVAAFDLLGVTCQENAATLAGTVRVDSGSAYEAVDTQPRTWDFGEQVVGHDGPAKHVTFTNTGVDALKVGAAKLVGLYPTSFVLGSDNCPATLAAGASCTVSVAARPVHRSTTADGQTAYLQLPLTGPNGTVRARQVPLFVQGRSDSTTYVSAGPERATVSVGKLPAPYHAAISGYRIDRRTAGHSFTTWRDLDGTGSTTDAGLSPSATYVYVVRPLVAGSATSDWTTPIAARPWPKYGSGMYHRLTPFRLISAHTVRAGHPYTLLVGGKHSVPSSHVEAVVLNVTVSRPSSTTAVYVYPYGTSRPAQADLTVTRRDTKSNFVIARVSSTARFVIATAHGSTPVTVDVSGYYATSALTTRGYGAAMHQFVQGGTTLDTKYTYKKPLPGGYFVAAPMNFDPASSSRVTSLEVVITAYGSKGSGTIAGFRTGDGIPGTSVLSYRAGQVTSATAIIAAGLWHDSADGHYYPSVSFYNRGRDAVQLRVTTLGYFDDATFLYGQRYYPSSPVHLLSSTLYTGSQRTLSPGHYATEWTSAMNLKITASSPTRATAVSAWPAGYLSVRHPVQPQLRAPAGLTTTASTIEVTGGTNRMYVDNATGRTRVNVWSFGRFDAWPVPQTPSAVGGATPNVGSAAASVPTLRYAPLAQHAPMYAAAR